MINGRLRTTTRRVSRIGLSLGVLATLATAAALPTFAAADTGVTITGNTLAGGGITFADFGSVTLNGTQQTTTATWSTSPITDSTGTGNGWNLSLSLTQFKEYSGSSYVAGGKALATSSVQVSTAPIVAQVDTTSSAANTVTPVAINTALDGAAVKLFSAAAGGGMGSYSFTDLTATLRVPANTYARTYRADATVSLNSAP